MARISEIVKSESEAPANVIRLARVQNGFVRAYNKSAWKFYLFIQQYKLKRMYVKSINAETVSLGFREENLHHVVECRQFTSTELGYDLLLKEDEKCGDDDAYEQWFSAIPINDQSSSDFDALPLAGANAEKEAIRRIRTFPLERKTPLNCQLFFAEIKELLDLQQ